MPSESKNSWKDWFIGIATIAMIGIGGWALLKIGDLQVALATLSVKVEEREKSGLVNLARFEIMEKDIRDLKDNVDKLVKRVH